jgi:hypothetical protein
MSAIHARHHEEIENIWTDILKWAIMGGGQQIINHTVTTKFRRQVATAQSVQFAR